MQRIIVALLFSVVLTAVNIHAQDEPTQIINPFWPACGQPYTSGAGGRVNVSVTVFDGAPSGDVPDPSLEHAVVVHIENNVPVFLGEIDPADFAHPDLPGVPHDYAFSAPGGDGQVFVSMLGSNFLDANGRPTDLERNPDFSLIVHNCDLEVTVNGHNAWSKTQAKNAALALGTLAGFLSTFSRYAPGVGQAAGGLSLIAILAGAFAADPVDCAAGIQKPDFSAVTQIDTTLTGIARLGSAIQFNTDMINALGQAAMVANNRASCPTRSVSGQANQFAYAQRLTNRMGNRLLTLQMQLIRVASYLDRKGADTSALNFDAVAEWGMQLASGVHD